MTVSTFNDLVELIEQMASRMSLIYEAPAAKKPARIDYYAVANISDLDNRKFYKY